jgi:putative CocE/NonD family hydrolase
MRDDVDLATNVYRPDAEGQFPVILSRTPYGRTELQPIAQALVPHGYAFVLQDVRGRFDSEGNWEPFFYDAEDGHDTIEWIADQPWSNGRVVMMGGSYAAGTQWLAAREGSEHLVGIVPYVSPGEIYDIVYTGGAFKQSVGQTWSHMMEPKAFTIEQYMAFGDLPWGDVFSTLPVTEGLSILDSDPDFFQTWLEHPTYDSYWQTMNWQDNPPDIPALHITGWYDIFQADTIRNFELMRSDETSSSFENQRLLVGPWAHNGFASTVGDVDFGKEANYDAIALEMLPFFQLMLMDGEQYWEKPVKVFTMGENAWNEYDSWPVEGTMPTPYYLDSSNGANSLNGDGSLATSNEHASSDADTYTYDPSDAVPTNGGGNCCFPAILPWGPYDQRDIETRQDVLVFSTPPLESDVRVTGSIEAVIYVSSNAPDTDFTAKLVDVSPEGYAMNLTDGIARMSSQIESYKTGTVVELRIDLGYTSNLFKEGHQIRLEISSSNFPRFSRNTNTGINPQIDTTMRSADQTLVHTPEQPSRLILPVISEE